MYYYSAATNAFYPDALKPDYLRTGTWPDDATEVDDNVYQTFAASAVPEGKIRIAGKDGLPAWGDIPPPTAAERRAQTQYQKQLLLTEAAQAMAPLQDAVDLGIATQEEIQALNVWKEYRVQLSRIDISAGADINWPEKPE